jgi:hypothetical protein
MCSSEGQKRFPVLGSAGDDTEQIGFQNKFWCQFELLLDMVPYRHRPYIVLSSQFGFFSA